MHFFIIVTILIFSLKCNKDFISLSFDTYYTMPISRENFFDVNENNYITTNISLGTPLKAYRLNIELQSKFISLLNSSIEYDVPKYSPIDSSTLHLEDNITISRYLLNSFILEEIVYYNATKANETFQLGDSNKISDLTFLLVYYIKTKGTFNVNSGVFGLSSEMKYSELNTLKQLKEKNLILNEIFFFEYKNDYEGKVIMGVNPHKYNSKKYKESEFKTTKSVKQGYDGQWVMHFNYITFNGKNADFGVKDAVLSIETGYIFCPFEFSEQLEISFFQKYINKGLCWKNKTISSYYTFSCIDSNEVDFKLLPYIYFYNEEMNMSFTFTYEDLFIQFKGIRYFLVYFNSIGYYDAYWIFGKPFMKKYIISFNMDGNIIGSYKREGVGKSYISYYFLWIALLFCFVIIGILVYFLLKLLKKMKKKKAIELNDGFDYETKDDITVEFKKIP